ncbi:hypothetical protein CO230_06715 [Chryseobacterium sp. 6424]|nr:hypothetical protein CO230_06715 [Chryseobacterium sp. 6424]
MQLKISYPIILLIFLFSCVFYSSQDLKKVTLTNEEIEKRIDSNNNDSVQMWNLINLYISKSKKEKNLEALFYAYRYGSIAGKFPTNIKYADSALSVAKNSNLTKTLIDAYLNRGNINMAEENYQKALEDILNANKLSQQIGNEYIYNKTIYIIAQNKIYLGQYEDAKKELEVCLTFFKSNLHNKTALGKNYEMYYLYSLMSLIDSNTKLGLFQENRIHLAEAFQYVKNNNLNQYLPYFITSEGLIAYYSKDYTTAISKLSEAIRLYNDQWTHITEIYYLGLSYWHTGKKQLAIKYLEEIDKHYTKTKKLDPQFRSAYEILIKYYTSTGNTDKQLEYINKLMYLDRSYEKNYKYLYQRIVKEYDTKKLVAEKNRIENTLQNQRIMFVGVLVVIVGGFVFFGIRIYREKQNYKKRFEEILAHQSAETPQEETVATLNSLDLPQEQKFDYEYYNKIPGLNPLFVENILQQLDIFETEKRFLDPQISQKLLSEEFGTNSTYFSKIINTYKGKTFTLYINDLRLDYIINHLKNDIKYINMDVKELAAIAGFSSAENFSSNFRRKFDMKPSVFIKMMRDKL